MINETRGMRKAWLKREIARLDAEWHRLLDPSPMGFTVNNYHRWPVSKLAYVVELQDRQKVLRREVRAINWAQFKSWVRTTDWDSWFGAGAFVLAVLLVAFFL